MHVASCIVLLFVRMWSTVSMPKERCTALGASLEAGDEIVLCEAPKSLPAFLFGRDLILVFQIPRNDVNFSLEDFFKLPRREGLRGYITKFQEM